MSLNVEAILLEIMNKYGIPCCIFGAQDTEIRKLGSEKALEEPSLPRTLFWNKEATAGVFEYLSANKQPRIVSQGNTRSVMGLSGSGELFCYFFNSELDVIKYYELAKEIYDETIRRI